MLYTLKNINNEKLYSAIDLNDIVMFVFNTDKNIRAFLKEKNKEIVFILSDKTEENSLDYITENYNIFYNQ